MKCPACNGGSRVTETRAVQLGSRRRRICVAGHKFTTHEVVVGERSFRAGRAVLVPLDRLEAARDALAALLPAKETT